MLSCFWTKECQKKRKMKWKLKKDKAEFWILGASFQCWHAFCFWSQFFSSFRTKFLILWGETVPPPISTTFLLLSKNKNKYFLQFFMESKSKCVASFGHNACHKNIQLGGDWVFQHGHTSSWQMRCIKELLPTPESPMTSTRAERGCAHIHKLAAIYRKKYCNERNMQASDAYVLYDKFL